MTEQKKPFHLIGGAADPQAAAAELARLRAEIEARNRQENAVAEFGQAALTGVDPSILLGQACAQLAGSQTGPGSPTATPNPPKVDPSGYHDDRSAPDTRERSECN